jgi:hypothetical protein
MKISICPVRDYTTEGWEKCIEVETDAVPVENDHIELRVDGVTVRKVLWSLQHGKLTPMLRVR